MNKTTKIAAAVLIVSLTGMGVSTAMARGGYCDNNPRMMMQKKGGGFMSGRYGNKELDLTQKEVQTLMEARMIMRGNDRLKVGKIAKKDDSTYLVDIVTVDDSLVRQVEIDKDTGRPSRRMRNR